MNRIMGTVVCGRAGALFLAGLFILSGCAGDGSRESGGDEPVVEKGSEGEEGARVFLPVFPGEYDPQSPANEALMVGVTRIVDGCVRVGSDPVANPGGVLMIWPAESKLVEVSDGDSTHMEIRDYRDSLLVRIGDTIRMGGSGTSDIAHLPAELRQSIEENGCIGPYWLSGHPLPREYW